jgi:Fe-S cluster assembly protein SufD
VLPIDRNTHERVAAALSPEARARAAAGMDTFESLPAPTERDENWRYVHAEVDLGRYRIAEEPGASSAPPVPGLEAIASATNVDGHTVAAASTDGVSIVPLGESGAQGPIPVADDRFVALHEAFSGDGVLIRVAPKARLEGPAVVTLEAVSQAVAAFPRIRIEAGESSHVSVIVNQWSPEVEALVVPRFEVNAEADARVELTVLQQWGTETTALARHHFTADRDSTVLLAEAGLGARYSRLHLSVDLVGDGSNAEIIGAYFGDADQVLDYRYFMRHAARGTTSEMFLKGAVAGEARSVFSGLIRIEPEGQKTSAHQTNRNLVLSDGAEAHSVPNLEILADDVRCGHGSAVGPLDEEQRYYLMSRGLQQPRADRLQVKGFFEQALQRFPDQNLEPLLREAAMAKYSRIAS